MSHVAVFVAGVLSFFVLIAVISRLASLPNAPKWLDGAFNSLTHLFNGAFGL